MAEGTPVPRSGRCAIVGRPNVGKSTLLNALLGQKLAIATPKPQTTRTCVLGVYVSDDPPTQIAFVDTPGLHRPHNALGRAIVEGARRGLEDADAVIVVVEADTRDAIRPADREVLAAVQGAPVILAINKVDRLGDKSVLLPQLERLAKEHAFAAVVPISATRGTNLRGLVDEVRRCLPEGLAYDGETVTDRPERFFCAELVREAVIRHTREEVPHGVAVVVETFTDEPGLTRIGAVILVAKESHKGIVIGKGGARLKQIGTDARLEMEALLERKVFLELWVKTAAGWTDDPRRVAELAGDG